MQQLHEIRADFDAETIVIYQAYAPAVAEPALAAGRFVPPFSFGRMTWIKPSFRWLMHRSNWARKPGQERVLAVRITRAGWEEALGRAVLTTADPEALARAEVHVQWDPERSLRGAALNQYSIQVGVGRTLIRTFAEEWITGITDLTPQVRKIAELVHGGRTAQAQRLLPPERPYPLPHPLAARLAGARQSARPELASADGADDSGRGDGAVRPRGALELNPLPLSSTLRRSPGENKTAIFSREAGHSWWAR